MKLREGDMQSSLLAEARLFVTASPEQGTQPNPPTSEYVLSAQGIAMVEPATAEYPGFASSHADDRAVAEYFPAAQSVHEEAWAALNLPASHGRQLLLVRLGVRSAL